ncbi:carbohydrate ABC transporter permease [Paenibacillus sp. CGMCC 1.16610]|uniref:ABC transporter permease subunit n=1 Tax=Paenibacillus anseongense TaxID=2682845 RepID=A0ABW9U432_9BACL|nr:MULTISPECIES: carbohydrate ABC transporter permease [Paenibacillus]MBA2938885.1 carbohydrate ABC transporter permease [Paenibacillus sp. CGMCC 1.16610]MVQ34847.1 ABC transporter permease subunit [Paenibacillus anseongense]
MSHTFKNRMIDYTAATVILIAVFICLVPFLYILSQSLSSNTAIISQAVTIYPIDFNIEAYKVVFRDAGMLYSLFYTIILTAVFVLVSLTVTILAAYPLTKKRLKGRNVLLLLMVFTMYFSGGLIPDYLNVKNLSLLDTPLSLILPGMMSVYYMIILKSFFQSLPESLEEAAHLDGCNELQILIKIVLPLSKPALATVSLLYAVFRWNYFQDALFYITDQKFYTIQLKLYNVINLSQQMSGENLIVNLPSEALKAASIMFGTIPILLVYPWLQKYFVSGIMIGAVKG